MFFFLASDKFLPLCYDMRHSEMVQNRSTIIIGQRTEMSICPSRPCCTVLTLLIRDRIFEKNL